VIYLLYTLHIIICLFLILVVLLQQGKGADLSVFGGGSTMAAFGARSATNLLHRLTVGAFVAFILTTLGIAYLKGRVEGSSVMKGAPVSSAPATTPAPATPPSAAPVESAPAPATDPAAAPAPAPPPAPGETVPAGEEKPPAN
jgi:preprotein translocase subunit SecG